MNEKVLAELRAELDRMKIVPWGLRNPPMVRAKAFVVPPGKHFQEAYGRYVFNEWVDTQSDKKELRRLAELLDWDLMAFLRVICKAKIRA